VTVNADGAFMFDRPLWGEHISSDPCLRVPVHLSRLMDLSDTCK